MPAVSEKELREIIKTQRTGAFLLYGEEKYLVKVFSDKITGAAVDDSFGDFNFKIYEGDDFTLEDIYESATSVPMMAETKCVLVRDFSTDKFEDKDFKAMETILKENPEDNCLVFTYAASTPKTGPFGKLVKLFEQYGYATDFSKLTERDAAAVLEKGARGRGKTFAPGAAVHMVDSVGSDLNLLNKELEKVCAYVDNDLITKADIDEICIKCLDTKVFDMVKDLTSGKFDAAFHKLDELFAQREEPTKILGALISQYADMYRAKAMKEAGAKQEDLIKYYPAYGGKMSFKIGKAATAASSMTMKQMRNCIDVLAKADIALKGSSVDDREILEKTIVMLARSDKT